MRTHLGVFICSLAVCCLGLRPCANSKYTVFKRTPNVCYRIPAVVKIPKNANVAKDTLIAFAEARYGGGCGDGQVLNIEFRRSTDNGRTWTKIGDGVAAPHSINNRSLSNVGNPMPMVSSDGSVVLVYVYRIHPGAAEGDGNAIVKSSDGGYTWSYPQDISNAFGAAKGSMPGPGAGIEVHTEKLSRMVVVSHYGAYQKDYVTYKDPSGDWTTIDTVFPKMDEATMADLGDGKLLLNFRHQHERTQGRAQSKSRDGGLTWTKIEYNTQLMGPVCQASLATTGDSVYFSNQDDVHARRNLTIKKSKREDFGEKWSYVCTVQEEQSAGYSSLVQGAVGDSKHGGIVYESNDTGDIVFKRFLLRQSNVVLE